VSKKDNIKERIWIKHNGKLYVKASYVQFCLEETKHKLDKWVVENKDKEIKKWKTLKDKKIASRNERWGKIMWEE